MFYVKISCNQLFIITRTNKTHFTSISGTLYVIRNMGGPVIPKVERHYPLNIKFEYDEDVNYKTSGRSNNSMLEHRGHRYVKNNYYGGNIYWKCTKWHAKCKARAITSGIDPKSIILKNAHNHE